MNTCPRRIPKNDNVFIIASGSPTVRERIPDDSEYATYVWSFLAPPAISQATPIISARRYEVVRKALDVPRVDSDPDIESTHIMTSLHLDELDDGTLVKTKSKTEVITYKEMPHPGRECPEYCDPKCKKVELENIPNVFQTFMDEEGLNTVYQADDRYYETDD